MIRLSKVYLEYPVKTPGAKVTADNAGFTSSAYLEASTKAGLELTLNFDPSSGLIHLTGADGSTKCIHVSRAKEMTLLEAPAIEKNKPQTLTDKVAKTVKQAS
jgi:hypothetical protein